MHAASLGSFLLDPKSTLKWPYLMNSCTVLHVSLSAPLSLSVPNVSKDGWGSLQARRRDSGMTLGQGFPTKYNAGIWVEFFEDPAGDFISEVTMIELNRLPSSNTPQTTHRVLIWLCH